MRRSVVTGGAGHVGSHLCARLLADGRAVHCVDDFSTGAAAHIDALADDPAFHVVEHDVTHPLDLDADEIYHLACPAAPVHYRRDPVRTFEVAVLGTHRMLALARAKGARFLLASTSEVYGDPEVHPQPETYAGRTDPLGPRACYVEGKRAAETLAHETARQHGVAVRIARLFNTYGPHLAADDGRVIPAFVQQARAGAPLTIHGDGRQTRSFCYVDDVVDGLVRLMDGDATGPVNLGNPDEISILELAETIRRLTGSRSPLRHVDAAPGDPRRRCPDIEKARRELGFAPRTALEDGLARTISWFSASPPPPSR